VANLNLRKAYTEKGLLGWQYAGQVLEISQRKFHTFSSCASLGSYLLRLRGLGIHLEKFLTMKTHVSITITYHPSAQLPHEKLDASTYIDLSYFPQVPSRRKYPADW
jgi:hypothetical protein